MAKTRFEQIRENRLNKIDKLEEVGVNPYPASLGKEPGKITDALQEGKEVTVAGRILGWREHGNVAFGDLCDATGQIQIFFQKKHLGDKFKVIKNFDIGDFVLVWGKVMKTQAGELTVDVSDYQLLAKSVRPLPSSWHGLKDVEERYRKRYLDMIMNDGVKKRLQKRSEIIAAMRLFLDKRGFIEVETPTLQPVYGGGFAKPFVTHHNVLDSDFYLRISDEMYLKRLIIGGFEKVYEITKVFRNEGIDYDHNPEFTMFEAQVAYQDYNYGMDLTEEMIEWIAKEVFRTTELEYQGQKISVARPWKRIKVVEAIKEFTGIDPLSWASLEEAKSSVMQMEIPKEKLRELGKMRSVGEMIAFAFEETAEEKFIQPTIVYDYPIEISPLSKKCEDGRFTQRFEVFAFGSEIGNNYTELNDPVDLYKRFVEEKKREKAGFSEAHQTDYDYLEAIEYGFPPTCGFGIGIDRLVMMMTDAKNIREVIAFPTLRPTDEAKKTFKEE